METALSFGCFARLIDSNRLSSEISQKDLIHLLVSRIYHDHPVCINHDASQTSTANRSLINNIIKGRKAFTPILNCDLPNVEEVSKTFGTISDCFDEDGKKRILSSLYELIQHDTLYDYETQESFKRFFGIRRRDFLSQPFLFFNQTCAKTLLYTTCTKINKDKAMAFLMSFNDTEFMQFQNNAVQLYAGDWSLDLSALSIKIPEPIILDREYLHDLLSPPINPEVKKELENLPQRGLEDKILDDCIDSATGFIRTINQYKKNRQKPKSQ